MIYISSGWIYRKVIKNQKNMRDNSNNDNSIIFTGDQEYLLETEEPLAESLKMRLEKIKTLKDSGKTLYGTRFDKNADIARYKGKIFRPCFRR